MLAAGGLEARPAFDPFPVFIAIVILINVVSSIIKAAQRRAAKPPDDQTQVRLDSALLQSRAQVETARAAQLAKLREALAAARVAQAGMTGPSPTTRAPILFATTAPPAASPPASLASASVAARSYSRPPDAQAPAATYLQPQATLASFDFGTIPFLDVAGPQAPLPLSLPSADSRQRPLAVLQGPRSGANLFIAAAIIGPCSAFRPPGHTPGGW